MEPIDIREKGGMRGGQQQTSDRRLFMQFLAFGDAPSVDSLSQVLADSQVEGVLYEDINDPKGIGLLTWNTDPDFFVGTLRSILAQNAFRSMRFKPEYTMLGRTYAIGYEPQLEEWLLNRPRRVVTNPKSKWHVWYPLRRKGEFNALPGEEQSSILREHGKIGLGFGEAGLAHDVRLACFGLDKNDNDFIIGLIGQELFPLSACIQAMRKTQQTAHHMQEMGPFFIGKAVWQHAVLPPATE